MIYVANPICDSAFKYLMEDERIATMMNKSVDEIRRYV